jgi:hypothetical protein
MSAWYKKDERRTQMKLTLLTALAVVFVVISLGQSPETQIVRLSPAAFPELPANLVQELQRRQCTVPQETFSKNRNNVIKGEFAKPGQTDWAVLCSVRGVSTILVFWNGSEKNPAALASVPDNGFVQFLGRGQWGYSRGIEAVGKDYIMRHYEAYGGPKPPPIDHQGINDVFIEKASVVLYLYEGQWLKLTGAD